MPSTMMPAAPSAKPPGPGLGPKSLTQTPGVPRMTFPTGPRSINVIAPPNLRPGTPAPNSGVSAPTAVPATAAGAAPKVKALQSEVAPHKFAFIFGAKHDLDANVDDMGHPQTTRGAWYRGLLGRALPWAGGAAGGLGGGIAGAAPGLLLAGMSARAPGAAGNLIKLLGLGGAMGGGLWGAGKGFGLGKAEAERQGDRFGLPPLRPKQANAMTLLKGLGTAGKGMWNAFGKQTVPTLGGAVLGGVAGHSWDPTNSGAGTVGGAAAGAAAFNPVLRKAFGGGQGNRALFGPSAGGALRRGLIGTGAGEAIDQTAAQAGIDTRGMGARLGGVAGVGSRFMGGAGKAMDPGSKNLARFYQGSMEGGMTPFTAPFTAAKNFVTGSKTPMLPGGVMRTDPARRVGQLVGLGGAGLGAGAAGLHYGGEYLKNTMHDYVREVTPKLEQLGDEYLESRLPHALDIAQGHLAQMPAVQNLYTATHPLSAMYQAMGLDPSQIGPWHGRAMGLGALSLLGGLASGHPALAGAGAGGMAYGAWPGLREMIEPRLHQALSRLRPREAA